MVTVPVIGDYYMSRSHEIVRITHITSSEIVYDVIQSPYNKSLEGKSSASPIMSFLDCSILQTKDPTNWLVLYGPKT